MAGQDRMTIEEVVRKVLRDEHADVIRESVKTIARELMEAEVSELIGAELGERRPDDRATHRNGYRSRRWDTRAGEVDLQIPKLRQGSYFSGLRISKSEVSRIAGLLDEQVQAFGSGRWKVAAPICSSTPRSRRSATVAASRASASQRKDIRVPFACF